MKLVKKVFGVISFFIILSSFFTIRTLAEGEFKTDVTVTYNVQPGGITKVVNTVSLENLYTDLYAASYSLVLDHINPENITATENGQSLKVEVLKSGSGTTIKVSFPEAVVGKGNRRTFNIDYDDPSVASRTGEVWEIAIPRLSVNSSFASYNVALSVPTSFGLEAYLSPTPTAKEIKNGANYYTFDKTAVSKTGITAGFGEFQVFSFNLMYHLENPLPKLGTVDIAVPPDTSLQRVYYDNFTPEPENIHLDPDGNWLATYTLKPRERLDVGTRGYVQIFAGTRPFPASPQTLLAADLKPTIYWQADDPTITALARELKTPENIYDFVSTHLTYNIDRAAPNVVRLGAVEALKEPKNAICMEFTDLFVAIARAAGIPAREVNGYAYTQNPKIQPLSLVSDVLHAWPEYWDTTKNAWIAVDPTWGSTTGGIDFFNKLDLRHFAFVMHGVDPQRPYPPGSYKLGPSPQKDVFVNFAQLPERKTSNIVINYKKGRFIPFLSQKIQLTVRNAGDAALYNLSADTLFDNKPQETQHMEVLPPYGHFNFEVTIPFSFLAAKTPQMVQIVAGETKIAIDTGKKEIIVANLAVIFAVTVIILLAVLIRLHKISYAKIKNLFKFKKSS